MFGLAYFRAYAKQFMQINMFLCIIYKFVNVACEMTTYKCTIFVNKNLWMKIKTYLFA